VKRLIGEGWDASGFAATDFESEELRGCGAERVLAVHEFRQGGELPGAWAGRVAVSLGFDRRSEVEAVLAEMETLVLVAGLGGEIGSAGSSAVWEAACEQLRREGGFKRQAVVTVPFAFEEAVRGRLAGLALEKLRRGYAWEEDGGGPVMIDGNLLLPDAGHATAEKAFACMEQLLAVETLRVALSQPIHAWPSARV
jgi:cell division GTPase FtsZ